MSQYAHRLSTTLLTLKDAQGNPMPGRQVTVDLSNHEFLFGSGCFWLQELLDPATPAHLKERYEKYWESWKEVFNYATLPFYQGRYEPQEGVTREEKTLRSARYLKKHGYTVKGHPLCWHTASALWLLKKDNQAVLENQLARIRREIGAFHDAITLWDVINEVVIMPIFEKEENAITRLCQEMGRVPLVKAVFDMARQCDPNATLLINDFNTSESYRQLIEDCLAAGVPIDVIGIQSHQHQGFWGMEKLLQVLDRFASFGKPMHFTEDTFVSGDLMPAHIVDLNDFQVPEWPSNPAGEDRQARDLLTMIDTLFAHPLVEAHTNWDFEDGAWLGAPSGLVHKDGTVKPAYEALKQRVLKDWHTHLTLMTDENGQCSVEGYRGLYTLQCDGRETTFTLNKTDREQTIQLG